MLILTSMLLITFGVFSSATSDDFCKTWRVDKCFASDQDVPVDFPDSVEDLDKICPIILPRLTCMLDFKNKCSENDNWSSQFETLENVNGLWVEACDKDSKFHKELALHLPCTEDVFMNHRNTCRPIVKEALEDIKSDLNLDFEAEYVHEEWVKYFCMSEALEMSCFVASTFVSCGEKTGDFVGSVLEISGILGVACPEQIREEVKAEIAIVQNEMKLRITAAEIISKIK